MGEKERETQRDSVGDNVSRLSTKQWIRERQLRTKTQTKARSQEKMQDSMARTHEKRGGGGGDESESPEAFV